MALFFTLIILILNNKMETILHNLPPAPYKKFFGRKKDLKEIYEKLINGHTYIASIDGVGGIGKSALAYYFCHEVLINGGLYYDEKEKTIKEMLVLRNSKELIKREKIFDYVVWITAKENVFDSYAKGDSIKEVKTNFKGIETLVQQ